MVGFFFFWFSGLGLGFFGTLVNVLLICVNQIRCSLLHLGNGLYMLIMAIKQEVCIEATYFFNFYYFLTVTITVRTLQLIIRSFCCTDVMLIIAELCSGEGEAVCLKQEQTSP